MWASSERASCSARDESSGQNVGFPDSLSQGFRGTGSSRTLHDQRRCHSHGRLAESLRQQNLRETPRIRSGRLNFLAMLATYNAFAGRSVQRLAALSDGIFAVAMTLLVLDLIVPTTDAVHSEHDLWRALVAMSPGLLMLGMRVLTLGIFWVGQQTQLNHLERSDRDLSWIHIAFLGVVSLIPFSTALLAQFTHYRIALLIYGMNIVVIGGAL